MTKTLIALALLAAGAAQADGVQDSLESCRQLQAGPLPVTCSVKLDGEVPTFLFGFLQGVDKDEATIAIAAVTLPICNVIPVRIMFFATDGQKITGATAANCVAGQLSAFQKLDPSTLKPAVY